MEGILHQIAILYDPRRPLFSCDEWPCFLLEEAGASIPLSPGKAMRYHDEDHKNGSCGMCLAFAPHTGLRYGEVRGRRTALDDAACM